MSDTDIVVIVLQMAALLFAIERAHSAKMSEQSARQIQRDVVGELGRMASIQGQQTAAQMLDTRRAEFERMAQFLGRTIDHKRVPTGRETFDMWQYGWIVFTSDAARQAGHVLFEFARENEGSRDLDALIMFKMHGENLLGALRQEMIDGLAPLTARPPTPTKEPS